MLTGGKVADPVGVVSDDIHAYQGFMTLHIIDPNSSQENPFCLERDTFGAQVLVGGKIAHPEGAKGDFFQPTVLTGVTPAMRIWREEVFGPVMVVVRALLPAYLPIAETLRNLHALA